LPEHGNYKFVETRMPRIFILIFVVHKFGSQRNSDASDHHCGSPSSQVNPWCPNQKLL